MDAEHARSTKVGRLTPTTHRVVGVLGRRDGRSTKVGRLTPTTPDRSAAANGAGSALNEGREVNPDDTPPTAFASPNDRCRSTKVGRLTPTTLP